MNVISSTTIERYAALHADAAEELLRWNKAASHAVWRDVNEVRQHFPDADQFKSLLIFNIRHNYYRLIVIGLELLIVSRLQRSALPTSTRSTSGRDFVDGLIVFHQQTRHLAKSIDATWWTGLQPATEAPASDSSRALMHQSQAEARSPTS